MEDSLKEFDLQLQINEACKTGEQRDEVKKLTLNTEKTRSGLSRNSNLYYMRK